MDKEEQQFIACAYAGSRSEPNDEEPRTGTAVSPSERTSFRLLFRLNAVVAGIFFFIGAAAAGCAYLILSNHLITQGFAFNSAKAHMTELAKQNRELELAVMQGESYAQMSGRIAALGMVAVGDVEYVEIKNSGVALR